MAELLGPSDPLPPRLRRVLVTGASGSGKSTLARAVGERLGLPYTELDSLYHGPGWVPRPSFVADVQRVVDGPAWVAEWQYSAVRERLAVRADLMVWLDLPRRQVLRQVTRRTLVRRWTRAELWNGNREPPLWTIVSDPEHIIRWSWKSWPRVGPRVAALMTSRPELPVVHLSSRRDVRRWLLGPLEEVARNATTG